MVNLHEAERVERLKKRAEYCVCKYCGEPLRLRQIVFSDVNDAKIELYCNHCEKIEYGVEKEIYLSAENFVDQLEFDYYEGMDDNEKKRQMNIAKVCEIIGWSCKHLGIIDEEGFTLPLDVHPDGADECLVMFSKDVVLTAEE